MEIIVLYSNRKMYSRVRSVYVNLEDIKRMIVEEKIDVQVISNTDGADVTAKVLIQVLTTCKEVNVNKLRNLIRESN
jgi:polyhydroxyalkanoate synthesis regulator protein